jgi:hypothetical protein
MLTFIGGVLCGAVLTAVAIIAYLCASWNR